MRIAFGSDLNNGVTEHIARRLRRDGHDVTLFGALAGPEDSWIAAGRDVAQAVSAGAADCGIACCWTGTGVCMAAGKVRGVRAALCTDARTAAGAREWNDANVLALSLRLLSTAVADEILDAWFAAQPTQDPKYRAMIAQVDAVP